MKSKIVMSAFALMAMALVPATANASSITCGSQYRLLTVYNVTSCNFGDDQNANAGTVAGILGGTWTTEGKLTGGVDGTNDLLTVDVIGAWGPESDGTFSIDPSFWTTYGRGALSFHVGQGQYTPDYWVFELESGFTGLGTFDLDRLTQGGGGGLSNIVLYGSGSPTTNNTQCEGPCAAAVPEPASLMLLGMGLTGIAVVMRRKTAKA